MTRIRATLAGFALLTGGLLLAGCDGQPAATPTPAQQLTQAAVSISDADVRYLRTVRARPALGAIPDRTLTDYGHYICGQLEAGVSSLQIATANSQLASMDMATMIGAASGAFCPATTPAELPAAQPVPATPSGPASELSDGTWEVGVDALPGKYKSPGNTTCYWARLRRNDGGAGDIVQNNFSSGPQTVTLKAKEFFQSQRCGSWTKVG